MNEEEQARRILKKVKSGLKALEKVEAARRRTRMSFPEWWNLVQRRRAGHNRATFPGVAYPLNGPFRKGRKRLRRKGTP